MTGKRSRFSIRKTGRQIAESLSVSFCLPARKYSNEKSSTSQPDTPKPSTPKPSTPKPSTPVSSAPIFSAPEATNEAIPERASWPAMSRLQRLESISRARAGIPPVATSARFRRYIDSLSRGDYAVYEADQRTYSPGKIYYVPQWRLDELQAQSGAHVEKGGSLGNERASSLNGGA